MTDAHLRNALAGIRGLGRAGIEVVALGPRRSAPGLASRYASASEVVPDAVRDPAGFAAGVAAAEAVRGPAVVYPGQEASIDALLGLDGVRLPYGSREALERVRDKRSLAGLAAGAGLAAPATLAEATAAELAGARLATPLAVKPARPGGALPSTRLVGSDAELRGLVASLPPDEPLLVQERVPGRLIALGLVVAEGGEVLARFQQETRRTWPPDAGISSLAVSVAPDEALVARAARLLADAGYAGLAQLQLIHGERPPALIDVNPRFYGSLPLALACGVNLPAAWHALVTGGPPAVPEPYRVGVGFRWLEGDFMTAIRGRPGLMLARAPRPAAGAVWSRDDPLPSALYAARAVGERIANRLPGRGGRAGAPR